MVGFNLARITIWRRGRVVERACFENMYACKGIGGSNPPASAYVSFD